MSTIILPKKAKDYGFVFLQPLFDVLQIDSASSIIAQNLVVFISFAKHNFFIVGDTFGFVLKDLSIIGLEYFNFFHNKLPI